MAEGIFHYYFLLSEDAPQFINKMAPWLENAGFRKLTGGAGEGLPQELPFKPGYWQFSAGEGSSVLALALSPEGSWQDSLQLFKSLEQDAGVDVDIILGQATIIMAPGKPWEELLMQYQVFVGKKPVTELPLKAGRLMRYVLSSTKVFYIAAPEGYDAKNSYFWGQRLAQLEAQYLKVGIISRLLGEQLNSVKRETEALDNELSLILHSNLVSNQGELNEPEALEGQLKLLITSYAKLAGSRHLISKGKANLQTLVNQFTRQLRQEPAFDFAAAGLYTWIDNYQERLDQLTQIEAHLQVSQQDYQAAIDVVRSRIDMMNNRSNLATQAQIRELMEQNTQMQKQSLVFQYAASLIEFIVLAYYSHSLWKNLAHEAYNMIPASIQFIVVLLFSGTAVYCTHHLAEYIEGEHEVKNRIVVSLIFLALLLVVIIAATAWLSSQGAGASLGH